MIPYFSFVEFILFSWTSLFFGYLLNEAYHTPECQVHSEDKHFYSLPSLRGIVLEFGFLSCPQIMFLVFQRAKATPCASSSFDDHMATNLYSVVWKFATSWFFWWALPQYQIWSMVCFSADTYMANREWCPSMPISPCNNREGGRERQPLSLLLSCDSGLLLSSADGQMY